MSSKPNLISFPEREAQNVSTGASEAEAMDVYSRVVTTVAESVSPAVVRIQVENKQGVAATGPDSFSRRMGSSLPTAMWFTAARR